MPGYGFGFEVSGFEVVPGYGLDAEPRGDFLGAAGLAVETLETGLVLPGYLLPLSGAAGALPVGYLFAPIGVAVFLAAVVDAGLEYDRCTPAGFPAVTTFLPTPAAFWPPILVP